MTLKKFFRNDFVAMIVVVIALVFMFSGCLGGAFSKQRAVINNQGLTYITGIADGVQETTDKSTTINVDPGSMAGASQGIPKIQIESTGLWGIKSIEINNASGGELYIDTALRGAQIRDLSKVLRALKNPFAER